MPKGYCNKTGLPVRLGKKHSKKTKEKLASAWNTRRLIPVSKETRRKMAKRMEGNKINLGRKQSIETRKKISEAHKGEKAYNYKGYDTSDYKRQRKWVEFRLWREAVFARDNWTCQKCRKRGGEIHPHHIFNFAKYPKLRFAIDNGITFCKKCHRLFHKIYGNKNNNKNQITKYLNTNRKPKPIE